MLRFRLLGIPFEITPYFWIGSAILGSGLAQGQNGLWLLAIWILCVGVSIVIHELGHAVVARSFGIQPRVALYQFGGLTFLPGVALSRGQHILVSLAGPAAGFLAYGVTWVGAPFVLRACGGREFLESGSPGSLALTMTIWALLRINGVWTLFNLLPIMPLDGGQVLRDVLGPGLIRATRIIGAVCAAAVAVWAGLHGQPILAFFLGYLGYSNLTGNTRALPGGTGGGQG